MAIQGLTSGFAYTNFGEKNQQSKPQESCKTEHYYQRESSRKSVFQQLQLLWVLFYTQVLQLKRKSQQDHACQVHPTGPNVLTKRSSYKQRISIKNNWQSLANSLDNLLVSFKGAQLRLSGFLYSLWANRRLRWGLLLLLVIAPLSKFIYLLFPQGGFGEYLINTSLITVNNFETYGVEDG